MDKTELLNLLRTYINSRPGFDWHNYGDAAFYRADMRMATRQRNDALAMLNYVAWHDSIPVEYLMDELQSGRLTLDNGVLNYCAGQYYCTEYRAAACRVLSSVIWRYLRDDCGYTSGDAIRKAARAELGRTIANRWLY